MHRSQRAVRPTRTVAALALGAAVLLTLSACQTSGGQAVAAVTTSAQVSNSAVDSASVPSSAPIVSSAPVASSAPASSAAVSDQPSRSTATTSSQAGSGGGSGGGSNSGSGSGGGSGSGSGSGSGGGGNAKKSTDPTFVSASAACVLNQDDGQYHLIVSWELANATGMALSVDNPGLVGSYGTYSWHGSEDLANLGCYADDRVQDIELYSKGGNGNQAKKTFHVHENHHRVTPIAPPPFAGHPVTTSTPPPTTDTVTTATTTTAPTTQTTSSQ